MMQSSLSRGHVSGITVVLSGRGFLSHVGPSTTSQQDQDHDVRPPEADPQIPVKLQLMSQKEGRYSIRVIHNDDRSRSQPPIISEDISDISIVSHTAQEFDFVLNREGTRHCMSFTKLAEGQQFQSILSAVKTQGQARMSSIKRGLGAMAARFPGRQGNGDGQGGGGGGTIKKSDSNRDNDRIQPSSAGRGVETDVYTMTELLKSAILAGDVGNAEVWARNLANLQPKLSILVETTGGGHISTDGNISIQVQVEDKSSSKPKLRMSVPPNITIAALKKTTFLKYDLPVQVQNWLIRGRIVKDTETLSANGITSSGATLYLYLTTAEKVNITQRDMVIEKHALDNERRHPRRTQGRDTQTRPNRRTQAQRLIPPSSVETMRPLRCASEPIVPLTMGSRNEPRMAPPSASAATSRNLERAPERPREKTIPSAIDVGWRCGTCTLLNPPLIPGCQACMTERPSTYAIPEKGSYVMDPSEKSFLEKEQENELEELEMRRREQLQNYQDLLQTDDQDLVLNKQPFDCPICLVDYGIDAGVVLRECLHVFCKECLSEHVKQSTDALVKCPGMVDGVPCTEHVLEREIKALLIDEHFQNYLERGLRRAESSAANSFHCKTTDCRGFCFYEDNNNFFNCPLCKRLNCLTCKAIHEGIDCKQYQEDLKIRAQNDVSARQTQETLEALVNTGEALKCPTCSIIVQKKGGCDWLKCSVCMTEICWVTKQARWGPAGVGDTSGGCRCRVNGLKCHPNCHNCH